MKESDIESIKLEASFFNGLAISTYFIFTTGVSYAFFFGDLKNIPDSSLAGILAKEFGWWVTPLVAAALGYIGGWRLHYRGRKVLRKLDNIKTDEH